VTGAQPSPDGDELRARHHLRRLGARPLGHQEPPMPAPHDRRPVTPTRVIPAGAPLPDRPPEPGEIPPWRTPPAPPPVPPPPPPAPVEVRHVHVHEVVVVTPESEAETPPLWARVWDRMVTWRMLIAVLTALTPWAEGRSPVGIWAATLRQARTEASIGAAYVIAGLALAAAWGLDRHTSRAVPRFLLVTALAGSFGVLDWYDPITALTGVLR